jgi:hypothetical protein
LVPPLSLAAHTLTARSVYRLETTLAWVLHPDRWLLFFDDKPVEMLPFWPGLARIPATRIRSIAADGD